MDAISNKVVLIITFVLLVDCSCDQGRLFTMLQDLLPALCFCHPCRLCRGLRWLGVDASCPQGGSGFPQGKI